MSRTPRRRPTLADVADRAGLSKAAVSMILNNRPGSRLSAEAAERARRAAAELGYRPNPAAQSLRLGKTRTIGFISDHVTLTRYASGLIRGVLDEAREHEHSVLLAETGSEPNGLVEAVQMMLDRRVDGIVVGLMAARLIDVPEVPAEVPVVVVNGSSSARHPNVLPDERAGGYAMARLLADRGHRRIGLIGDLPRIAGNPRRSVTIGLRFAGIEEAFDEHGIVAERVALETWRPSDGYDGARHLLAEHPDLTAILAGNDNVAFGVYQALAELGLRIPDQISVASFDDEQLASYQRPGLTTARLPYQEMGRHAVQMLIGDRQPGHELLPMPVVDRDSVVPADHHRSHAEALLGAPDERQT